MLTAKPAVAAFFSAVDKAHVEAAARACVGILVCRAHLWLAGPTAWKMVTEWTDDLHSPTADHAPTAIVGEKKRGRKRAAEGDASKIFSDLCK